MSIKNFQNPWAEGGEYYPDWLGGEKVLGDKFEQTNPRTINTLPQPSRYQNYVVDAANRLIVSGLGFPSSSRPRLFNSIFFETTLNENQRFVLKVNYAFKNTPHLSILDIFNYPPNYEMDCAEFIQYCHLYAKMRVLGKNKFNSLYNQNLNPLIINEHRSPGLLTIVFYKRYAPKEQFQNIINEKYTDANVGQLLASASKGSRIAVTNLDAPPNSSFQNENFLKVSNNEFIAHPLGQKMTIREIAEAMAKMTYDKSIHGDNFDQYRIDNVFISEIEIYEEP
jgi:hypothetical protein